MEMLHPMMQSNNGPSSRIFSVLLFLFTATFPLFEAQSELICSDQPIVALAGDDVILPCCLDPPINISSETVVWTKPGLDPKYVHVHRDGRLVHQNLNPSYYCRTTLFVDELTNGNFSLKIFKVKLSDAGKYFCILDSKQKEASIQLAVGAVSSPVLHLTGIDRNSGGVVLQCESEGWYPEPEVSWLDSEGHVLSAGPTETVRGPDGLYTVSSRVTVEKRHNNNFTCRVQEKNINQTRETQIHVPDDFFITSSHGYWHITLAAAIIAVMLYAIRLRWIIKRLCSMRDHRHQNQRGTGSQTEEASGLENNNDNERNFKTQGDS